MTTTLGQFRESLRSLLTDKTQWRDTLLNMWIQDGIRDYSHHLPRLASASITCAAGQQSYSLTAYTILQARAVEYPSSQTPRRLLSRLGREHPVFAGGPYYDLKADHSFLYLGESPALGEFILLEYDTLHAVPAADSAELSVPVQHFELLCLYVLWKATVQLGMDENVSVSRDGGMVNALRLNALAAEQAYRSRLQAILATQAQGGFTGPWRMDAYDRR